MDASFFIQVVDRIMQHDQVECFVSRIKLLQSDFLEEHVSQPKLSLDLVETQIASRGAPRSFRLQTHHFGRLAGSGVKAEQPVASSNFQNPLVPELKLPENGFHMIAKVSFAGVQTAGDHHRKVTIEA